MNKTRVAILFGGCSPEYRVSLESAHSVITYLDTETFTPLLIGISQTGDWFLFKGDVEKIAADTWCNSSDCSPVAVSPNREAPALLVLHPHGVERISIDAAFPVLHGRNGEDGTVQGLFELAGIPLVGCNTLASALCMDKDRAHKLAQAAGIAVAASFTVRREELLVEGLAQAKGLKYPLFIKPVKNGSSFGITKVLNPEDLQEAIMLAFTYDDEVIVEECVAGFEVGCAIMGNEELIIGAVDEIELKDGFFDFAEKYTLKTSTIHVPARITEEQTEEIKKTAVAIYRALGCRGFARVDLFFTPEGAIFFNEVNTIPGFTAHSRFPSMMKAAGLSLRQVISDVIALAV